MRMPLGSMALLLAWSARAPLFAQVTPADTPPRTQVIAAAKAIMPAMKTTMPRRPRAVTMRHVE